VVERASLEVNVSDLVNGCDVVIACDIVRCRIVAMMAASAIGEPCRGNLVEGERQRILH
jgi:hypothetical protein